MPQTVIPMKDTLRNAAGLVVVLILIFVSVRYLGSDELRAYVESAGIWAPLLLVFAKASTIIIAPLGGSPLYPLAGTLFGFWKGLFLVLIGDALGSTVSFWIGRTFGQGVVEKLLGKDGIFKSILNNMGTVRGFAITRTLLLTMQDLIAYAAGLSKLPFLPFITIHSAVGVIPAAILTSLGSTLIEGSTLSIGGIFAVLGVLGALSMLGYIKLFPEALAQNKAGAETHAEEPPDKTRV